MRKRKMRRKGVGPKAVCVWLAGKLCLAGDVHAFHSSRRKTE